MPAIAKVTKEMIIDAAFEIAKEIGAENINARTVSQKLSALCVMCITGCLMELWVTLFAECGKAAL